MWQIGFHLFQITNFLGRRDMKSDDVPLEIVFNTFYFLKVQPLISLL